MANYQEVFFEAGRRRILPADKQEVYDEAVRRGLVKDQPAIPDLGPTRFARGGPPPALTQEEAWKATADVERFPDRDVVERYLAGKYAEGRPQYPEEAQDVTTPFPIKAPRPQPAFLQDLTAPPPMTSPAAEVAKETVRGGAEVPFVDPPQILVAAATGGGVVGWNAAKAAGLKLLPKFMYSMSRAAASGLPAAAMEFPIGQAADLAAESGNPEVALIIAASAGFASGMTIERMAEQGILKGLGKAVARYPKVAEQMLPQTVMERWKTTGDFSEWSPEISARMQRRMAEAKARGGVPEEATAVPPAPPEPTRPDWVRKIPVQEQIPQRALPGEVLPPPAPPEPIPGRLTELAGKTVRGMPKVEEPSIMELARQAVTPPVPAFKRPLSKYQAMIGAPAGLEEDEEGNFQFNPQKAVLGMLAGSGLIGITRAKLAGRGSRRMMNFSHYDPMPEVAKSQSATKFALLAKDNPLNVNEAARKISADYTAKKAMRLADVQNEFMGILNRDDEGWTAFDRIWANEFEKRIANSQREGFAPYVERTMNVSAKKAASGNIKAGEEYLPLDTVRGCPNMCPECYAKGTATKSCRSFVEPSAVRLTGNFLDNPKIIRRFGETGEPSVDPRRWDELKSQFMQEAQGGKTFTPEEFDQRLGTMYDWAWFNEQLRKTNLHLPEAHPKVFTITKLNSITNFDPSVVRNLEVSIDPMTPHHFFRSLNNVEQLLKMDPDLNIALRIRSVSSYSDEINAMQKIAVEFANKHNLPVLETRLRFKGSEGLKLAQAQVDYVFKQPQIVPVSYAAKGPKVREIAKETSPLSQMGLKKELHALCNEPNISGAACGKCQNCRRFLKAGRQLANPTGVKGVSTTTLRMHPATITGPLGGIGYGVDWETYERDGTIRIDPKKALIGAFAGTAGPTALKHAGRLGGRVATEWDQRFAEPLVDWAKSQAKNLVLNASLRLGKEEDVRFAMGWGRSEVFQNMFRTYKTAAAADWTRAKEIGQELEKLCPTRVEQRRAMQVLRGGVTANAELQTKAKQVQRLFTELRELQKKHDLSEYSRFDKLTRAERAQLRRLTSGPDPATVQDQADLVAYANRVGVDVPAAMKRDELVQAIQDKLDFHRSRLQDYYHYGSAEEYMPVFYRKYEGLSPAEREIVKDELNRLKIRSRTSNPEGKQDLEEMIAAMEDVLKTGVRGRRAFRTSREKLNLGYSHRRRDMPVQVQRLLGLIEEAPYPIAKGLGIQWTDVRKAKLFEEIANNPEWAMRVERASDAPANFVPVKDAKFGALNGMHVRRDVWDDLKTVYEWRDAFVRNWDKVMGAWKFGKVILNPATHARNFYSNMMLAFLGDVNPWDVDTYNKAARAMIDGPKSQHYADAKGWGLFNDTYYSSEISNLRDTLGRVSDARGMKDWVRTAMSFPSKAYEGQERFFKMAVFIKAREAGLSVDEAARKAEKFLFNYNDIPPWVRFTRRWAAPFITFAYKALPLFGEMTIRKPHKIAAIAASMYGIEAYAKKALGLSEEQAEKERELLPDWMRRKVFGTHYIHVLTPWPDKWGDHQYWDLGYILPYGTVSEEWGQSGIPFREFLPANPFLNVAYSIFTNKQSFTGRDIYNKTLVEAMDRVDGLAVEAMKEQYGKQLAFAWRELSPSLAPGGYGWNKLKTGLQNALGDDRKVEDWAGRPMELQKAVLSALFGIKLSSANQQKLNESEIKNRRRISEAVDEEIGKLKSKYKRKEISMEEFVDGQRRLADIKKQVMLARPKPLTRAVASPPP